MLKIICRVMLLIFCLLPVSAYSSDLSRKVADVQIKKAMGSIVKTASVREGDFQIYGFGWETYQNLAAMGFITARELDYCFYNATFLPAFRKYIIEASDLRTFTQGLGNATAQRYTDNKVLLWRVKYNKITGIKKDNNSMSGCGAQVTFTCNVEKSPFVSAFANENNLPDNLIALTACFSQYDDGWRLEHLNIPTWVGVYDDSINAFYDKLNILNAIGVMSNKTVWKPKGDATKIWLSINTSCNQKSNQVECITAKMKKLGATQQAVAFTKLMKGEVYLSSFKEMGKVDLAVITRPLYNDPNVDDYILVNGTPEIVNLWENARKINIKADPIYPSLAREYPNTVLWPMHTFKTMQQTSNGGQRFIFDFILLNGCHACDLVGSAEIAFDFNKDGIFEGTR